MRIQDLFLDEGLSKTAKEKGFNEPCMMYYYTDKPFTPGTLQTGNIGVYINTNWMINAPLYQQIIDWFRDKHFIFITADLRSYEPDAPKYIAEVKSTSCKNMGETLLNGFIKYDTPRQALQQGIQEAFKLI